MSLEELVDNDRTHKNTIHSYLPIYQDLFINKKETANKILEIGVDNGGSIKLWYDFFINADIYGLDIMNIENVWDEIKNKERIKLYTSIDAYDNNFVFNNFINNNNNIKFDIIIEDGAQNIESSKTFIRLYSKLLSNDGILIIENIQDINLIPLLKDEVPENLQQFIKIYDLRHIKNTYNDILLIIDKSQSLS